MPSGVVLVYFFLLTWLHRTLSPSPRIAQRGDRTTADHNTTPIAAYPSVRMSSSAKKQKLPFYLVIHALLLHKTCPLRLQKPAFAKTGFYS